MPRIITPDEERRRIKALRENYAASHAAKQCGISKSTMNAFIKSRRLEGIIGTKLPQTPAVLQAMRYINKQSKLKKKITPDQVVTLLIQTGSISKTARRLKINKYDLTWHCRNTGWNELVLYKKTYNTEDWNNPYKLLVQLSKRKKRECGLARKLFDRGFLIPVCGFQNTPTGINYDHKDKIGGWNCPMFGPSDYDPEEPFMWGDVEMDLGCGFEVDHIDGESWNDHWNNIRVLCMTCHTITSTYRGWKNQINRTNKRKVRRLK